MSDFVDGYKRGQDDLMAQIRDMLDAGTEDAFTVWRLRQLVTPPEPRPAVIELPDHGHGWVDTGSGQGYEPYNLTNPEE